MIAAFGYELLAVNIAANGFLHHMVRNIVGTLLLVGEHKLDLDGWQAIVASGDRRKAGRTAPAHGLYLMSVFYPHDQGKEDSNITQESTRIEE